MDAVTLDDLTQDEQDRVQELVDSNAGHGWRPVDELRGYAPGVRIRHVGQRYYEAYERGTGIIVVVLRRNDEIELLVAYDRPRFSGGSRITQLGSYHVDRGPFSR